MNSDLNNNRDLLRNTIDSSLDMIQVFEAVRDEAGGITDFVWILNNKTSESFYGDVIGKSLLTLNPGVATEGIFDTFKKVVETGEPDQSIRHYVHEQFDGWFLQSAVKQGDGVATTTKDISDIKKAEEQIRISNENLQATLDNSLYFIQAFEAVRDKTGQIVDFKWLFTNRLWQQHYGDVTGKSLLKQNPGVMSTGLFDLFVQVTQTGISIDHEQFYAHEQLQNQWFHQTLVKMGDGFVMNTLDITQRKKAEQELLEKQALLESVLNNTESSIMLLKPIRDDGKKINDFQYVYTNDQTKRSVKRNRLAGKRMTEEFPELKNSDLLNQYALVAQTGESFRGEVNVLPYGFEVWAQVFAQHIGGDVLVTYFDVTDQKKKESELHRLKDDIARIAEDKYRTLFNSIDQGFNIIELIFDEDGKAIDYWQREHNPAFTRLTGIKDAMGKRMSELVPFVEPEWHEMLQRIYNTGEPVQVEYPVKALGKWFRAYMSKVGAVGSKLVACIYDDITERKHAEERQAFLLKLSDTLRAEHGVEATGNRACELIAAHLKTDRVYLVTLNSENDEVNVTH